MSKGQWKPNPANEAKRLIEAAEAKGYEVTSIEKMADGSVRLGVQRPSAAGPKSESDELRSNL